MKLQTAALAGALAALFAACPPAENTPDAGVDAGIILPDGACTGGCGPNQICDTARKVCVDACGGCDGGVCTKDQAGNFACVASTTSCNGSNCGEGQVACLNGGCSCLPFTRASSDSCYGQGMLCTGAYNPAAAGSGACRAPKRFEACKLENCSGGNCAACSGGTTCEGVFTGIDPVCVQGAGACGSTTCQVGEMCDSNAGCLPSGLFFEDACISTTGATQPDGSLITFGVPVANLCLLRSPTTGAVTETTPTGNCSYEFLRLSNREIAFSTCRPPGGAGVNQPCKLNFLQSTLAQQCGSGLQCAPTGADDGVCLPMCNAAPGGPGFVPQPGCSTGEVCVNIHRQQDTNSNVGVCMKECNVFVSGEQTCAAYGSNAASCVPTDPQGNVIVTGDGSGFCAPQKATVANAGQACSETDAFKGAACANGLVCMSALGSAPSCEQPCDLACAATPAPTRCGTEPNATCSGGKTCTAINSASFGVLGICR